MTIQELTVDVDAREVRLAGDPVHLTTREFDLLVQFARNPGRVYTRTQLLDLVWGYGYDGYEHTVNSHINRLRAKTSATRQSQCSSRRFGGSGTSSVLGSGEWRGLCTDVCCWCWPGCWFPWGCCS